MFPTLWAVGALLVRNSEEKKIAKSTWPKRIFSRFFVFTVCQSPLL